MKTLQRTATFVFLLLATSVSPAASERRFEAAFYRGEGDVEYLQLLNTARRMFAPDPEFQNLSMLYMPSWNGMVEGPTWDAWWIQNSYGPTYCSLPFLEEPFVTFLENSHALWFDQMGDGQRTGAPAPFDWVAPDGCLCDAARPGWIVYRQGDGRTHLHDWGMEFTAAGLLMQSELLLIGRDREAVARYLPKLERCANFIETRRDPTNNLFLAGPAGNLLAPSFAGWKKPDGTYGQAYLTGLSVTYIAALDRLIELEKFAGRSAEAKVQSQRRATAHQGLARLATDEGYFIRSLDPDGTRHGVFGAARHGYFEASPNHDALAFRVADDAQAERIYAKIASIPGLRPHRFILPNYPSYDDMYEEPQGLWGFGTWVNGGHWSTCEARMILGYYRLGRFEDARRSMLQLLSFAKRFRMDNPLVAFGSDVYQPGQPINLTYDAFGPPAALVRGLFEYLYRADALTLRPHVPPGITRLEQRFPVRFGAKRLYLATVGTGPITGVTLNGAEWKSFDHGSVVLPYDQMPDTAAIEVALGNAKPLGFRAPQADRAPQPIPPNDHAWLALKKANLVTNRLPVRLGADSDGNNRFRGDIARARIFNRALSADEVATLQRGEVGALRNDPGLVADWNFEQREDGAFVSKVGQSLRAKVVGQVERTDAPMGSAIRLDGSGYLEVAASPALNLTDACTLEAWICPRDLPPGGARIIDKSQVGTSNGYLLDTHPGNSLRVITQAGVLSHPAKLAVGEWVQVAATLAPDGALTLYVQGKPVAHRPASAMAEIPSMLRAAERVQRFHRALAENGLAESYEAAHARLALDCLATAHTRLTRLAERKLEPLADPVSQAAADQSYLATTGKHLAGLARVLDAYGQATGPRQQRISRLWGRSASGSD